MACHRYIKYQFEQTLNVFTLSKENLKSNYLNLVSFLVIENVCSVYYKRYPCKLLHAIML